MPHTPPTGPIPVLQDEQLTAHLEARIATCRRRRAGFALVRLQPAGAAEAEPQLLAQMAQRVRHRLRVYDDVLCHGGQEVVVVLSEIGETQLPTILRRLGSALTEPYTVAGRLLQTGLDVGWALPTPADPQADSASLLAAARPVAAATAATTQNS